MSLMMKSDSECLETKVLQRNVSVEPAGRGVCSATCVQQRRRCISRTAAVKRRDCRIRSAERRRIASEIHDEIGQSLTALQLHLEFCFSAGTATAEDEVTRMRLRDQMSDIMTRVRSTVSILRSDTMLNGGLVANLTQLVNSFRYATGVNIDLRAFGFHDVSLPDTTALAAYRIAQEAITNAVRHAHARHIVVLLRMVEKGSVLSLDVRDNGIGFDPVLTLPGFGRTGMHERAEGVRGKVSIVSAIGKGTSVNALLPLVPFQRKGAAS